MSTKYNKVKKFFDSGFWNIDMVRDSVSKGWITPEEFELITKMKY